MKMEYDALDDAFLDFTDFILGLFHSLAIFIAIPFASAHVWVSLAVRFVLIPSFFFSFVLLLGHLPPSIAMTLLGLLIHCPRGTWAPVLQNTPNLN